MFLELYFQVCSAVEMICSMQDGVVKECNAKPEIQLMNAPSFYKR